MKKKADPVRIKFKKLDSFINKLDKQALRLRKFVHGPKCNDYYCCPIACIDAGVEKHPTLGLNTALMWTLADELDGCVEEIISLMESYDLTANKDWAMLIDGIPTPEIVSYVFGTFALHIQAYPKEYKLVNATRKLMCGVSETLREVKFIVIRRGRNEVL